MKVTTGCGLNVLLVEQERATLPVPPFIPHLVPAIRTSKCAKILTMVPVPSPSVSSSASVVNVLQQATARGSAEDKSIVPQHSQLNPATFKPVTLIKAHRFEELLKGDPNRS